jgi:predicted Fe-Mo cluster-binding NifX family protein
VATGPENTGERKVKFAVTSQDYLTITGHAGKTTRFLVFEAEAGREPVEVARLDIADEQTVHNYKGGEHPLDGVEVVIVGSAGQCFIEKMASRGIATAMAPGVEPSAAVAAYVAGLLKPAQEAEACDCHGHDHDHDHDRE